MADRIVEAEAFVLKDAGGMERGRFALGKDGQPELVICHGDGGRRAAVRMTEDGPVIELLDDDERARLALRLSDDGNAEVAFEDEDGPCFSAGDSGVSIHDRAGIVRIGLGLNEEGFPFLNLADSAGQIRIALAAGEEDSFVILFDEDGTPIDALPRS